MIGDILVEVENKPVGDIRELQMVLEPESIGKTLHAVILRGGQAIHVDVTIGERHQRSCC